MVEQVQGESATVSNDPRAAEARRSVAELRARIAIESVRFDALKPIHKDVTERIMAVAKHIDSLKKELEAATEGQLNLFEGEKRE